MLHYIISRKNYLSNSEFKKIVNFHKEEIIRLNSEKSILNEKFNNEENERKQNEPIKFKESEQIRRETEESNYREKKNKYESDLNQFKIDLEKYNQKLNDLSALHNKNEEVKLNWYKNLSSGSQKEVEEMLELLFPLDFNLDEEFLNTDPSDVEVGYNVTSSKSLELMVTTDKELSFIPKTGFKLTASGKEVSEYNLTQKSFNDYSNSCLSSIALIYAKQVFDFCTSIDNIKLEICIPGTNKKTGEFEDEVIIQMDVEREIYKKINYSNIDPKEAITNFQHEFKRFGGKAVNINSSINTENIIWSTKDDSNINLDNYILTKFSKIYTETKNK
jgi:hypothetical protein